MPFKCLQCITVPHVCGKGEAFACGLVVGGSSPLKLMVSSLMLANESERTSLSREVLDLGARLNTLRQFLEFEPQHPM